MESCLRNLGTYSTHFVRCNTVFYLIYFIINVILSVFKKWIKRNLYKSIVIIKKRKDVKTQSGDKNENRWHVYWIIKRLNPNKYLQVLQCNNETIWIKNVIKNKTNKDKRIIENKENM